MKLVSFRRSSREGWGVVNADGIVDLTGRGGFTTLREAIASSALDRLAEEAFDDVCPHAYALLSQGFVEGNEIECPLHGARFEIATGRCVAPPADRDLQMHDVRIEGDDIYVGWVRREAP